MTFHFIPVTMQFTIPVEVCRFLYGSKCMACRLMVLLSGSDHTVNELCRLNTATWKLFGDSAPGEVLCAGNNNCRHIKEPFTPFVVS